jgi:hypothetical protein
MDTQKLCSGCGILKDISEYYKSQRGTKCKECKLIYGKSYKREKRKDTEFKKIESEKQKKRRVRLWINSLVHDSKRRNIEHTITKEEIEEIYDNQNGLCYWFGVPLIPSLKHKYPLQPSLDRLDRNRGYTKDNIVICCYTANIGRNENDLETWLDFLNILKNTIKSNYC